MLRVVAEEDDEERNRPSIRKRAERQTNNMFSSMITVPEDNSTTSAENAIAAAMAANLATADDTISNATPTKRGSMLDDSFRSTNSLVNKMQSALNEEWWMAKRQHSPPPQDGPPVKTLLLSDNQQHRQSGNQQVTKSRTKKADLIFGLVLLTVGFVIGGIFIHRDKLMYEMNALLGGSTKQNHQGDPRQLPIIQHTLTYEERAQLYREKRQAGMLRPIGNGGNGGKLGIDEQERLRYQQYFGYDQLREGHHQGESKF